MWTLTPSLPTLRRRSAAVLATALGVFLGGMLWAPAGEADFNSGLYTHTNSGCASRVNPIGAVFYGTADLGRVQTHVWHHAWWGGTILEGSPQYFALHGVCYAEQFANADNYVWNTRHHMRMRQTVHGDASLGTTTVGTPHFEERVGCGHALTPGGFDRARQTLYNALSVNGPHNTYYRYWGNTQPFTQCNGWVAASNGNVRYFHVPA